VPRRDGGFVCSRTELAPGGGVEAGNGHSAGSSGTGGTLISGREALSFSVVLDEAAKEMVVWRLLDESPERRLTFQLPVLSTSRVE